MFQLALVRRTNPSNTLQRQNVTNVLIVCQARISASLRLSVYIYIIPCASKHDKNVGLIPKHEVLGGNTRFPILVFFSAHAIFEGRATGT